MNCCFKILLMIVLKALLSGFYFYQHDAFANSFTIPFRSMHSIGSKRMNINFVTSVIESRNHLIGPLFAKKRKKKKYPRNSKSNAAPADVLVSNSKQLSDDHVDVSVQGSVKENSVLDKEASTVSDSTMNTANQNVSVDAVKTQVDTKVNDVDTSPGLSAPDAGSVNEFTEITSESKTTSATAAGTITDVLNTLLESEENPSPNKREEADVSAYNIYLQWVQEQEKGQELAPSQENAGVYNLYLDWVQEQETMGEDRAAAPQKEIDTERVQEIIESAKVKFAEEDRVQAEQLDAAKSSREMIEEQVRIQAEELKKRFAEEDRIRQQNIEALKESRRLAEEQEKRKTEALKMKFQNEDKNQAKVLNEEGIKSNSNSEAGEEVMPFPELNIRQKSSTRPSVVMKEESSVVGRTWMSASEKIQMSRAVSNAKEIPDSIRLSEGILMNKLQSSQNELDKDKARALALSSESFQRALLAARFALNNSDLNSNNDIDRGKLDSPSEESLIAARKKLEEIRMQKPSQKPKLDVSVKENDVDYIKNEYGTVEAFLDSLVGEKSQNVNSIKDDTLDLETEDRDHHHDHEDIDMTESILAQYGSVEEFVASINVSQDGDIADDEEVDMTDSIIAQYGSVEEFFSTFEKEQAPPDDNLFEELNEDYISEVDEIETIAPTATQASPAIEAIENMNDEQDSNHETTEDDEVDMTGSIIAQRHVYRLSPSEGAVRCAFVIEDRQYFKVQNDNSLESYGDRCFILRGPSEKTSIFDFELGPALLTINGLKDDHDLDDESRRVMWQNAYATMLYCVANPFIIHGEGLGLSSCTGLVGILSILGLGHAYPANADVPIGNINNKSSLTPKALSKILITDASENNILKCIDNLQVSSFPANKVNLGLLDPTEDVAKNMFRAFDFVLSCDCAKDPYGLATVFATTLKVGPEARFVHITSIQKDQKRLQNAVNARLRTFSKIDEIVLEKLNLTPLVFVTQDEANSSIQNVDLPICHEDLEVKEAESLFFTALTGYQDTERRKITMDGADFVDNNTW